MATCSTSKPAPRPSFFSSASRRYPLRAQSQAPTNIVNVLASIRIPLGWNISDRWRKMSGKHRARCHADAVQDPPPTANPSRCAEIPAPSSANPQMLPIRKGRASSSLGASR